MKKTTHESKTEGRIVNVSSYAHQFSYRGGILFDKINDESSYQTFRAYGQSKLANVLHTNELARRLKEDGADITANSLHPGVIVTNIFRYSSVFIVLSGVVSTLVRFAFKNIQQCREQQQHVI
ncbi:Short-chain dehydrogenase TIC 32 [Spatholobus suberectus]|nr:Short-chain dehydrogenase TIC 32 [Spatholobus suberectus]